MRGNLVPDKRRDVNGRLVTRYVKPHAHTSALFEIPAPTARLEEEPLDESQFESWEIGLIRAGFSPDAELDALLTKKAGLYDLVTTDAEVYGMLSVLEPKDAIPLMNEGIRTREETLDFLRGNNLMRLRVDRSAHVKEALSRCLSAQSYLKVCETKNTRNVPLYRVLDAVETHAMAIPHSYDFHGDVLRGDISVEDIRIIGVELIGSHASPVDIRELLWDIKNGSAKFDAAQLRALIESADKSNCSVAYADDLAFRFGVEETLRINDINDAYSMLKHIDRIAQDDEVVDDVRTLSLIRYYDAMRGLGSQSDDSSPVLNYDRVIELHDAEIDPKSAWEGLSERMSLRQIAAIKKHDIPPSVSEGWL